MGLELVAEYSKSKSTWQSFSFRCRFRPALKVCYVHMYLQTSYRSSNPRRLSERQC